MNAAAKSVERARALLVAIQPLLEVTCVVVSTWLLLGWWFTEPLMGGDGPRLFAPYTRSALESGTDWTQHLYRFGVVGGSTMHGAFGTSPVVQLGAALGLSTTTTTNISALLTQMYFGFFGLTLIAALVRHSTQGPRPLVFIERVVAISCCAFAPVLGWRFAAGHENLLLGIVPWFAAISLWWGAGTRSLSVVQVLLAWFAVFHAVSELSQQTLWYSLVFGAPVVIASLLTLPPRRGAGHLQLAVILAVAAGVLIAAPRLAVMFAHYGGPDSSRDAATPMFDTYGAPALRDWLTSIPWTSEASRAWPGVIPAHETNYPIGPLVVVAVLAPVRLRGLAMAVLIGGLLAIAFSLDNPLSSSLRALPLMEAFRVPARAILPLLAFVPVLSLAALWSRVAAPASRDALLAGATLALMVATARFAPSLIREVVAWGSAGVLVLHPRMRAREARATGLALATIAGLGIASFVERAAWRRTAGQLEVIPATLRQRVLARAPELAMPLHRVQIPNRLRPFEKSLGFAAGLPTLDGVWFPPRGFLELLGALRNKTLPPAESDFSLTDTEGFDLLAQLYNVRYVATRDGQLVATAPTNGPAWFVTRVITITSGRQMIEALRAAPDPRAALANTAWVDGEHAHLLPAAACTDARVERVTTDRLGQVATIDVSLRDTCLMVVATSYVASLQASASDRPLVVLPVDIALTGIVIPPGTTRVTLGPEDPSRPWWPLSLLLGLAALGVAIYLCGRSPLEALDEPVS